MRPAAGQIDIPNRGDPAAFGWTTIYYSAAALFSVSMSDEARVMASNRGFSAPAQLTYGAIDGEEDPRDDWPF
jgi:hypothetical protein